MTSGSCQGHGQGHARSSPTTFRPRLSGYVRKASEEEQINLLESLLEARLDRKRKNDRRAEAANDYYEAVREL